MRKQERLTDAKRKVKFSELLLDLWLNWLSLLIQIKVITSEIQKYKSKNDYPSIYFSFDVKCSYKKDTAYFLPGLHFDMKQYFLYIKQSLGICALNIWLFMSKT